MKEKLDMAEIRARLGITQQVMADMLGVDRKYVSMVETGVKPLSNKLAAKLAHVAEIQTHARERSWTTGPDGYAKNLHVRETGNPDLPLPSAYDHDPPCRSCAAKSAEIQFLRSALQSALDRIPIQVRIGE